MIDVRVLERLENEREALNVGAPPGWVGRAPGQPIVRLGRPVVDDADLSLIVEALGFELKLERLPPLNAPFKSAIELENTEAAPMIVCHPCNRETIVLGDPPVTDAASSLVAWMQCELQFERGLAALLDEPSLYMAQQYRRLIDNIGALLQSKGETRSPPWLSNPPFDPADRLQFWLSWLEAIDPALGGGDVGPSWSFDRGELKIDGRIARTVVNRMKNGKPVNIVLILNSFEELEWPPRIDNPLPGGHDPQKLAESLNSLNKGLIGIRFSALGGAGIGWKRCRSDGDPSALP